MRLDDLTDAECLAAWRAATRTGAGGPDGKADAVAIAIVLLVLASPDLDMTPMWLLNGLNVSSSNSGDAYHAARKVCDDIGMAARGVREARRDRPPRRTPHPRKFRDTLHYRSIERSSLHSTHSVKSWFARAAASR